MNHRDPIGAEKELRRTIQSNPKRPEARLLAAEGRFHEAIAQAQRAIELDPLSIRYSSVLGEIYYYARRYEESIRQCRQTLELDPNDVWVHDVLGDACERQGLQREAIVEWGAALRLAGDEGIAAALDAAYARGGFAAAVRALARSSLASFGDMTRRGELVPAAQYARAYLRLGQKEQALQWLSKACDEHNIFALFLNADPFYDELRSDPRFQELVKRIHVPD